MTEVRISHLSWTEYAKRIARDAPVVLIPVGALEQHGPHLPLATDSLIPAAICAHCAGTGNALVAPTLSYGYKSMPRCGGGQHFCGTTSLDAATLIATVKDIVRDFTRHGARKLAFVVGHMENQWFVNEGCDLAIREARMLGVEPPRIMTVGYWEFLTQTTIDRVFGDAFPNWALEHAGVMETSIMMHIHPELVHTETLVEHGPSRVPVYDMWPYDPSLVPEDGVLNTAAGASAEKGRMFFDEFTGSLSDALGAEFSGRSGAGS